MENNEKGHIYLSDRFRINTKKYADNITVEELKTVGKHRDKKRKSNPRSEWKEVAYFSTMGSIYGTFIQDDGSFCNKWYSLL
jgi:hypothetical protein